MAIYLIYIRYICLIYVSNHHIVHIKYIQFLFDNYTSIKLGKKGMLWVSPRKYSKGGNPIVPSHWVSRLLLLIRLYNYIFCSTSNFCCVDENSSVAASPCWSLHLTQICLGRAVGHLYNMLVFSHKFNNQPHYTGWRWDDGIVKGQMCSICGFTVHCYLCVWGNYIN